MRIKITESQLDRLLLEATAQNAFGDLEVGDELVVTSGGGKLKFKVAGTDLNSVKLYNDNQGSTLGAFTYILPKSEMVNDYNIRLFRYKNDAESKKDMKPYTFNNVSRIDIYDAEGAIKDSLIIGSEKEEENISFDVSEVLANLKLMKPNELFFFELFDGTKILFRIQSVNNDNAQLKLTAAAGESSSGYKELKGDVFTFKFELESITSSDKGPDTMDMILYDESGSPVKLTGVKDWGDYAKTVSNVNPDKSEMSDTMSKEEILNTIMSDPVLRDTFYKQPKLMGFINAGDPVGLATVNKVLQKYQDKDSNKSEKKKGKFPKFVNGKKVAFYLLDDVEFSFSNGDDSIILRKDTPLEGRTSLYQGNTYIRVGEGKKRYNLLILEDLGHDRYLTNLRGTVTSRAGVKETQNKRIQIKVLDYYN